MSPWRRSVPEFTRSTSRSPDRGRDRLWLVVLFFELLLVAVTVLITWFAVYAVYRLITDES